MLGLVIGYVMDFFSCLCLLCLWFVLICMIVFRFSVSFVMFRDVFVCVVW